MLVCIIYFCAGHPRLLVSPSSFKLFVYIPHAVAAFNQSDIRFFGFVRQTPAMVTDKKKVFRDFLRQAVQVADMSLSCWNEWNDWSSWNPWSARDERREYIGWLRWQGTATANMSSYSHAQRRDALAQPAVISYYGKYGRCRLCRNHRPSGWRRWQNWMQ